jgi:hypothetical protein
MIGLPAKNSTWGFLKSNFLVNSTTRISEISSGPLPLQLLKPTKGSNINGIKIQILANKIYFFSFRLCIKPTKARK